MFSRSAAHHMAALAAFHLAQPHFLVLRGLTGRCGTGRGGGLGRVGAGGTYRVASQRAIVGRCRGYAGSISEVG